MEQPVVEFKMVAKSHPTSEGTVHALRGFNLSVRAGELVAVMGPSGSGKSTLLNLVGGLLSPTEGDVSVLGRNLRAMNRREVARMRRRDIGFVFQDYNLIPSLTAAENVAMPLELDGYRPRRAQAMALRSLEDVELAHLSSRFPAQLSGGQLQRVAIARAIVGKRSLILADEPTGALDTNQSNEVMRLLRRRCDLGAAALLVTHDGSLISYADRVIRLADGRQVMDEVAV